MVSDINVNITYSRPSKDDYYLGIAREVSRRGTCLRRNFGAVIVKDDHIVSTGYNGAPRGVKNCLDLGVCPRQKAGIPAGERYELCRSVHAEANAIISASINDMRDSTIYLCALSRDSGEVFGGRPCKMCTRLIINAGIKKVVVREKDNSFSIYSVDDWIKEDDPDITKNMHGY
jgi:dCMP deaminase